MEKLTETQKNQMAQAIAEINQANAIPQAISELTEAINDLNNLKCDFTQWNIAECLSNIYYEMKRSNDLKEKQEQPVKPGIHQI
mgnify:CR=1 FL=1